MAGQKILTQVAGVLTEIVTPQVGGGGNANKVPSLDINGRLDVSMLPSGVGADVAILTASEALAAGAWVNVWNNAGAFAVRNADATTAGKEAMGFVLASVLAAGAATVYFDGINTSVTGQAPGVVYLSTTPGAGTATPPSATGNAVQKIGFALSATSVTTQVELPITLG